MRLHCRNNSSNKVDGLQRNIYGHDNHKHIPLDFMGCSLPNSIVFLRSSRCTQLLLQPLVTHVRGPVVIKCCFIWYISVCDLISRIWVSISLLEECEAHQRLPWNQCLVCIIYMRDEKKRYLYRQRNRRDLKHTHWIRKYKSQISTDSSAAASNT